LFSAESFNSVSKNKENILEKLHENKSKHGHDHVHADKNIEYFVLEYEKPFDKNSIDQQIGLLLWEKPDNINIIRCKALLDIKDSEFKHSLQG
jgi:G3E family GTPase